MDAFLDTYGLLILALLAAGGAAGIVAGLFGIGGGVVIVPTLAFVFVSLGYPQTAMHTAVGGSLATIVFTSARSTWSHHKRGAVDWSVVRGWTPWIMLGAIIGALLAGGLSGAALTLVFGSILLVVALQFGLGRPTWTLATRLPGGFLRAGLAGTLGALSGIMGIGGGVFGVTLLTLCGRSAHQAVGTAAAFGAAIGLPAAIGFAITGWGVEARPPLSIGYLNVPAILIIALMTTSFAPLGAMIAHRMNGVALRRAFGVVLFLLALNMLRGAMF